MYLHICSAHLVSDHSMLNHPQQQKEAMDLSPILDHKYLTLSFADVFHCKGACGQEMFFQ